MSKDNLEKKEKDSKHAPKKRRTIIRRRKKRSSKMYFNDETQLAIIMYQKSTDLSEKEKIYRRKILPSFEKLVENLINIHKFTGLHDSYDDLKHDCVTFLYETIGKYDSSRGTKAFSYFNVVAKNWLIIKTKQKVVKVKRNMSIDSSDSLTTMELKIIDEYYSIESQDDMLERRDIALAIVKSLYDIRSVVKTENELLCINAIITVFENIDQLDLLNKSAVLLYIREMSGLSSKQLTTAMQVIKKHWIKNKELDDLNLF